MNQFLFPLAQAFKERLTVDGLHPAALEVIIPAVKHCARLEELVKISFHDLFDQFICGASGFQSHWSSLASRSSLEVYFHRFQDTEQPAR